MAMVSLDCSDVNEATKSAFGSITMNGDENVKCRRCGFGGCDVRVLGCGCTLHGVSFMSLLLFTKIREKHLLHCYNLSKQVFSWF